MMTSAGGQRAGSGYMYLVWATLIERERFYGAISGVRFGGLRVWVE